MRRDSRLRGLSSDHHRALVLAPELQRAGDAGAIDAVLVASVSGAYEEELGPHSGFDERELLPLCEDEVDEEVLEAVASRAPAPGTRSGTDRPS